MIATRASSSRTAASRCPIPRRVYVRGQAAPRGPRAVPRNRTHADSRPSTAASRPMSRCASMIARGPWGDPSSSKAQSSRACRRCAGSGFWHAGDVEEVEPSYQPDRGAQRRDHSRPRCSASRCAPSPARRSPSCTTPARASSRRRWNSSPSAKISGASKPTRRRATARRDLGGQAFGASIPGFITPEFVRDEVAPAAPSSRPTSITRNASR